MGCNPGRKEWIFAAPSVLAQVLKSSAKHPRKGTHEFLEARVGDKQISGLKVVAQVAG